VEPDWRAEERVPIRRMLTPADLLSLGNGMLGLLAILSIPYAHPRLPFSLILLAGVLDGLDGLVARLGYGGGRLGGKLDTLADLVSFVVAPSMLFYYTFAHQAFLPDLGLVTGAFLTAAVVFAVSAGYFATGLLRLARFDYLKGGERHDYFLGVTTPGAAIVTASIVLADWDVRPAVFLLALTALLMTSRVRLPKLRGALANAAALVTLSALIIGDSFNNLGPVLLLVAFLGYLVLGPGYVRRRTEDEDASWTL
jgi:CDP-diacylglycerol---serine O-phosphatidyltransferase